MNNIVVYFKRNGYFGYRPSQFFIWCAVAAKSHAHLFDVWCSIFMPKILQKWLRRDTPIIRFRALFYIRSHIYNFYLDTPRTANPYGIYEASEK